MMNYETCGSDKSLKNMKAWNTCRLPINAPLAVGYRPADGWIQETVGGRLAGPGLTLLSKNRAFIPARP